MSTSNPVPPVSDASELPEAIPVNEAEGKGANPGGDKTGQKRRKPLSRWALVWRRLKRKPNFWIGAIVLGGIVLFALFGNIPNVYELGEADSYSYNSPPGAQHWFGTDSIGVDLYASMVEALRKSLLIGLLAAPAATLIAAFVGSLAGYLGGKFETFVNWIINLLLVLPVFYVLMIISPLLSNVSWIVIVVAIAGFGWMIMAQIVKNQTKSLKDREYVKAARYMGVGTGTILARHIIPNVASLLIIDACLGVSGAILSETSLSFFGLGIQPPDVSLGTLIANGQNAVLTRWWLFVIPASFLVALLTSVNLLGDALRDAIDPTSEVNRA
ncbi:ABC transporter permease [Dermabacter sp. p3-SID358]|uniref:ABC transporter permease n=1 Tax=Dermabacter sp. p3-SID358 TaxID=2916114 RepID=UPI0021A6B429|nr:ABC transporter permease [Dermabacter sp. p3-SID358]MCT1866832.1 ABC transporter permease [Dermabacter sp. p3-SID358]